MFTIPLIESWLKSLKSPTGDFGSDFVDVLNRYCTPALLLFLALFISTKQYFGSPIQCWMPAQFKGGWEQYTEEYCFVQNTYYVPPNENIPPNHDDRVEKEISYYQWVPVILVIQAMVFYIPKFVWNWACRRSGIDTKGIANLARNLEGHYDWDERKEVLEKLMVHLKYILLHNFGGCLAFKYFLVKLIQLANVGCQLWLTNVFLGMRHGFWAAQLLFSTIAGQNWNTTGYFPRVTLCDFDVRVLGNSHHHTVQCLLVINVLNEKIYLILGVWFCLLAFLNLANLLWCFLTTFCPSSRMGKVKKNLNEVKRPKLKHFVKDILGIDGVLILSFMEQTCGKLSSGEIICSLWNEYFERNCAYDL